MCKLAAFIGGLTLENGVHCPFPLASYSHLDISLLNCQCNYFDLLAPLFAAPALAAPLPLLSPLAPLRPQPKQRVIFEQKSA